MRVFEFAGDGCAQPVVGIPRSELARGGEVEENALDSRAAQFADQVGDRVVRQLPVDAPISQQFRID